MQLNGAIDRDLYGVDIKGEIIGSNTLEISAKNCLSFSVSNLGNVPVRIVGLATIGVGSCNTRSFENQAGLDYARNFEIEWLTDGIADPDARVEILKTILVRK